MSVTASQLVDTILSADQEDQDNQLAIEIDQWIEHVVFNDDVKAEVEAIYGKATTSRRLVEATQYADEILTATPRVVEKILIPKALADAAEQKLSDDHLESEIRLMFLAQAQFCDTLAPLFALWMNTVITNAEEASS